MWACPIVGLMLWSWICSGTGIKIDKWKKKLEFMEKIFDTSCVCQALGIFCYHLACFPMFGTLSW